jgi:thiol-disulfide isomerase/thioredoxin
MAFTDTVSYYLNPSKYIYSGVLYGILFFLILCVIAYYVYANDFFKVLNRNGESDIPNANANKGESAIMFFHVDWCPHCKTAKPAWDNIRAKYSNTRVNGYTCKFLDYNVTEKEEGDTDFNRYREAEAKARANNVEGYPTIKMKIGNDVVDFDAKVTDTSLEQFIQNVTKEN